MKNERSMPEAQFIVETATVAVLTFGNLLALALVIALLSVLGIGNVGLIVVATIMTAIAVPTTLYMTLYCRANPPASANLMYLIGTVLAAVFFGFVMPFIIPYHLFNAFRTGLKQTQRKPTGNEAFYSIMEDAATKATADFAAAYFHKHE